MTINGLILEIKKHNPDIEIETINKAYEFASKAHQDQKRASGEPYIQHPLRAAVTLVRLKLDTTTIAACLLHDVVEDHPECEEEFKKQFNKEIVKIVSLVTKISKIEYHGMERYAENLKKMILALSEDVRGAFIKLADRLDNLKTLESLSEEKQKRMARETLEIYAPLANRLGIGWMKGELEDAAFPYIYPKEYQWLMTQVKDKYEERNIYLRKIVPKVERNLRIEGIKVIQMDRRAKHYFSLYQKLQRYGMDISKIYDLVAFRIIVPTVEQCYSAMGAIHKHWNPLLGRVKDYIAMPKPNGYRSLHTTVFCEDGVITEFQIRTPQMHQEAEYGIAAHWYYSEQKGLKGYIKKLVTRAPEKELFLVKQIQAWQEEIKKASPEELFETVRTDLLNKKIFVFTPKGNIIELPEESCPIDFAYAIHSDVGNHCSQAIVNGKIESIYKPLKNGDIVEIIIDKKRHPSQDWLKFVKNHKTKNHIKKALSLLDQRKKEEKKPLISLPKIKLFKKSEKEASILVAGQGEITAFVAKCCQPKPGDDVIGYITKNKGVAVHKSDCKNLKRAQALWAQNIIPVEFKP